MEEEVEVEEVEVEEEEKEAGRVRKHRRPSLWTV
jgi:hypothetical protein